MRRTVPYFITLSRTIAYLNTWAELHPILIHWAELYPILSHWAELYPILIHWAELYPILKYWKGTIPYLNTLNGTIPYLNTFSSAAKTSSANQNRVLRHPRALGLGWRLSSALGSNWLAIAYPNIWGHQPSPPLGLLTTLLLTPFRTIFNQFFQIFFLNSSFRFYHHPFVPPLIHHSEYFFL